MNVIKNSFFLRTGDFVLSAQRNKTNIQEIGEERKERILESIKNMVEVKVYELIFLQHTCPTHQIPN